MATTRTPRPETLLANGAHEPRITRHCGLGHGAVGDCCGPLVPAHGLGASSFITKPVSYDGLVDVIRRLGEYPLEIVPLPRVHGR